MPLAAIDQVPSLDHVLAKNSFRPNRTAVLRSPLKCLEVSDVADGSDALSVALKGKFPLSLN